MAPLLPEELEARVAELPGWAVVDGRLHKEYAFADFAEAFAFMTRVALAAERLDHHPDWSNRGNGVVVDIVSHAQQGITGRCIELARHVEAAGVHRQR